MWKYKASFILPSRPRPGTRSLPSPTRANPPFGTCACTLPVYAVMFETGGGAPVPPMQYAPKCGMLTRPADPALSGFAFAGWYPSPDFSGTEWNFELDRVSGDMTLYAQWMPLTYTVTFMTNGGVPVPPPQTVPGGGMLTRPADPMRAGFTFAGWYQTPDFTGDEWNFDLGTVSGDMSLYARWNIQLIDVTGVKLWDDYDNIMNSRPEYITVSLYQNGTPIRQETISATGTGT